jgi:hypothetical protein
MFLLCSRFQFDRCQLFNGCHSSCLVWSAVAFSCGLDIEILKRVWFSFRNILNTLFAIGQAVSFCYLANFDGRSKIAFPLFVANAVLFDVIESTCLRVRFVVEGGFSLGLLVFYLVLEGATLLDAVPDLNPNAVLFSIQIENRPPIDISALAIFTQCTTATAIILIRGIYISWV